MTIEVIKNNMTQEEKGEFQKCRGGRREGSAAVMSIPPL